MMYLSSYTAATPFVLDKMLYQPPITMPCFKNRAYTYMNASHAIGFWLLLWTKKKENQFGPLLALCFVFFVNGMSSIGGLGRFFETAWCTAWPRPPPPKYFWTIFDFVLIFFINFLEFIRIYFCLGRFTRQCGLFQKSDPNPLMLDIPFGAQNQP
jgi:hypothetical protein